MKDFPVTVSAHTPNPPDPQPDRDRPSPTGWSVCLDTPDLSQAAFVAATATVVGQVTLGVGTSVWYGAVVRGDVERIEIGANTNIQDGAVLHGDPGQPTIVGNHVTIGHRAVIHSAQLEDGCLIGMGAIILNGVRIGTGSIVGAGAVVTKDVPPHTLVMGMPAKPVRAVSAGEAAELIAHAHHYQQLALAHAGKAGQSRKEVGPDAATTQ